MNLVDLPKDNDVGDTYQLAMAIFSGYVNSLRPSLRAVVLNAMKLDK